MIPFRVFETTNRRRSPSTSHWVKTLNTSLDEDAQLLIATCAIPHLTPPLLPNCAFFDRPFCSWSMIMAHRCINEHTFPSSF